MARTRRPIKYATPRTPKQKAIRITFHVLVWFGAAILYYFYRFRKIGRAHV